MHAYESLRMSGDNLSTGSYGLICSGNVQTYSNIGGRHNSLNLIVRGSKSAWAATLDMFSVSTKPPAAISL